MNYPRYLKSKILRSLEASPVLLLTGGRQTGKTTLMKELAQEQHFNYVSLDNIRLLVAGRENPIGLLEQFPPPLIIDEVQRIPEIALPIKLMVDENRRPGMFALTGSSNPLVAPKLSDSLAGRMFILHLWPLSQAEILGERPDLLERLFASQWEPRTYPKWQRDKLLQQLLTGGYPLVQSMDSEIREEWFDNHLKTLLERDIQDIAQIRRLEELPALLQLLAYRSGMLLNIAEIGRTAKIPYSSLSFYLTLLESLFLIMRQPAWHKNTTKRMTKSPKLYLTDPGMLLHLIGANAKRLETTPSLLGPVLETFVVTEIEKLLSWSSLHLNRFHYRTAAGAEVDLVLENRTGEVVGIEVKSSSMIRQDDFKGLRELQAEIGERFIRGVIFYTGEETMLFADNLLALPMSSLFVSGNHLNL